MSVTKPQCVDVVPGDLVATKSCHCWEPAREQEDLVSRAASLNFILGQMVRKKFQLSFSPGESDKEDSPRLPPVRFSRKIVSLSCCGVLYALGWADGP
jgi:hypothetical protein